VIRKVGAGTARDSKGNPLRSPHPVPEPEESRERRLKAALQFIPPQVVNPGSSWLSFVGSEWKT
jgi:hypothetical protein